MIITKKKNSFRKTKKNKLMKNVLKKNISKKKNNNSISKLMSMKGSGELDGQRKLGVPQGFGKVGFEGPAAFKPVEPGGLTRQPFRLQAAENARPPNRPTKRGASSSSNAKIWSMGQGNSNFLRLRTVPKNITMREVVANPRSKQLSNAELALMKSNPNAKRNSKTGAWETKASDVSALKPFGPNKRFSQAAQNVITQTGVVNAFKASRPQLPLPRYTGPVPPTFLYTVNKPQEGPYVNFPPPGQAPLPRTLPTKVEIPGPQYVNLEYNRFFNNEGKFIGSLSEYQSSQFTPPMSPDLAQTTPNYANIQNPNVLPDDEYENVRNIRQNAPPITISKIKTLQNIVIAKNLAKQLAKVTQAKKLKKVKKDVYSMPENPQKPQNNTYSTITENNTYSTIPDKLVMQTITEQPYVSMDNALVPPDDEYENVFNIIQPPPPITKSKLISLQNIVSAKRFAAAAIRAKQVNDKSTVYSMPENPENSRNNTYSTIPENLVTQTNTEQPYVSMVNALVPPENETIFFQNLKKNPDLNINTAPQPIIKSPEFNNKLKIMKLIKKYKTLINQKYNSSINKTQSEKYIQRKILKDYLQQEPYNSFYKEMTGESL